jgi:hypothetical protein
LDRLLKRTGLLDVAAQAALDGLALHRLVDDTRHQVCVVTGSPRMIVNNFPTASFKLISSWSAGVHD